LDSIKSPIYYTGNKYRLLNELQQFIPEKINTFIDVFGGSGVMAINFSTRSKKVIYNELDNKIYKLFKFLLETKFNVVNNFIIENSKQFLLTKESGLSKGDYKTNFYILRDYINENNLQNDPLWYYFISHYSFCNSITFNKKGKLDVSYGDRFYKSDIVELNLKHTQYFMNDKVELYNKSFEYLLTDEYINNLDANDYVYLDPPYFGTKANYNKGWGLKHEKLLLDKIEKIHAKGVLFGLSNIYKNKHIVNEHLIEWANKNNFIIYYPKVTYNFGGNGNSDSVEVFITNKFINYQESLAI